MNIMYNDEVFYFIMWLFIIYFIFTAKDVMLLAFLILFNTMFALLMFNYYTVFEFETFLLFNVSVTGFAVYKIYKSLK